MKETMAEKTEERLINIYSWNVEGKGGADEVDVILSQHVSKIQSESEQPVQHIVCVQQANLPKSGEDLKNYKWLCSGEFGSAILIDKASPLEPVSFETVCDQICVAGIKTDLGINIKIVSCYVPPSTEPATKDVWAKLVEVIKAIPCNMRYIIAGDFNAEIGKEDFRPVEADKRAIGLKLYHKSSNENGIHLKKLMINTHGSIASTFGVTVKPDEQLYTYKNGDEKSQQSYIIVPSDRLQFPSKLLLPECKISWIQDYKCAIISKGFKLKSYEKFSKPSSSKVVVSCWNVQGASPSTIDKALNDLQLPVVCVQDVFLTSENDVETSNYTWFTSKKLWGKNIGILVKTCPEISMSKFEVISEWLCVGDININGSPIKVVNCCLPAHTDTERFQEVTMKLMELVKNITEEIPYLVAGDFNTHITHTSREDTLVFDESDGNALFVKRFMKEINLEMSYFVKTSFTQLSEKVTRSSNHILMSPGCIQNYYPRRYVRWIPFFENGIVSLYLIGSDNVSEQDNFFSADGGEVKRKEFDKEEHVDGFVHVTKRVLQMKRYLSVNTTEYQIFRPIFANSVFQRMENSDLPDEIKNKYKKSPPPLQELSRILGDGFTLYHGFLQESLLPKGYTHVLVATFELLHRGPLLMECIDVLEEETKTLVKKLIKFRWNGIILYQCEGGKFANYHRIINKGLTFLISKLGQHFFTVKAKESFYNGLPPSCQDKEKLSEVMRVMKMSDFPQGATVEDVKQFINEFFLSKPQFELVFGPEFFHNNFSENIIKFVRWKSFGMRMFKSSEDVQDYDNLSVFIERSPQELRDSLITAPDHQDLRFQLLPPCGSDKDYFEWCDQWTGKSIPEEFFKPYEKKSITPIKRKVGFIPKTLKRVNRQILHKVEKCLPISPTLSTVLRPKKGNNCVMTARDETDLPQETVNKYCENPPPIKELCRILGDDFTLYYGFARNSCVVTSSSNVLAESFEAAGRGGLMVEYIQVLKQKPLVRQLPMKTTQLYATSTPMKKLVKFKWNGICIHEEEGSNISDFQSIAESGETALIDKLGQHFHTVKAKMTYYNNGLPPVCQEEEKLKEVLRVVRRSEFESSVGLEDVTKFIKEFFVNDTDMELVFGPEFEIPEFLPMIKKFIGKTKKRIGYREFKSEETLKHGNSLAVFIKRSPLDIRKKLMQLPDHHDMRFYLIPPCEIANKSHLSWITDWAAEKFVEEFILITKQKQDEEKKSMKLRPHDGDQGIKRVSGPTQKRRFLQTDTSKKSFRPQLSKSAGPKQQIWRKLQDRLPVNRHSDYHERNSRVNYEDKPRLNHSRDSSLQLGYNEDKSRLYYSNGKSHSQHREDISYRDYNEKRSSQGYHEDRSRQDFHESRTRQDFNENRSRQDYREARPHQEYFEDRSRQDFQENNSYPQTSRSVGRKRDWQKREPQAEKPHSWHSRSDEYGSANWSENLVSYPIPERYVPQNKRARLQPSPQTKRSRWDDEVKPEWDNLAPLVIVWPVNVRSEYEKNPRNVLEANFPTDISLETNNRVAVFVTLPLRNRRNKKFRLCVGDGVNNATKTALDMIVMRSSVIKYTANFLPEGGLVPNFIRYNIPCQTNPRTYITLNWMDTGPLDERKIIALFNSFKESLNEDLFIDRNNYTHEMKLMLLDLAPKHGLKVRHFGDEQRLVDRYVCVYKEKSKDVILEEVLKMGDFHPKYRLVSNKLPPQLGLSSY